MSRSISLTVAVLVGGLLMSSCGADSGSEDGGFHTTSEVVSNEATKDMLVFAPDAEGRWPVVVAFHGIGGTGQDMAEIATRLAREGSVVFAPTYGTDITTQEGIDRAAVDAECDYRFARSIAAEYGGDLDQPVTFVGWSLGASAALGIGLTEEIDPTGEFVSCFGQVPRPDIIVAMSGCHYEGGQLDLVDTEAWGNKEAEILLLAGEKDTNCPPWETEDAAAEMRSAGYEVNLLMLDGADHFAPVFHDLQDGQFVVVANDPAGERTVELILDAIAAKQHRT
ncbi:MAG TPA: dienelactone hydrolase family protein [Actinomycetota bacterium]